ncbi:MAG: BrnT family toxin [Xanthomonadales bacterium]|nr:BrnT family toxin [Xanthomonadales bacterium]
MINFRLIVGFDWDEGNSRKSYEKHAVSQAEAEQTFFNDPLLLLLDEKHSNKEARYHAYSKTDKGRKLHIAFTLRENNTLIRVISARDMHRKERMIYDKA